MQIFSYPKKSYKFRAVRELRDASRGTPWFYRGGTWDKGQCAGIPWGPRGNADSESRSRGSLRFRVSNKLPDGTDAARLWTTLWVAEVWFPQEHTAHHCFLEYVTCLQENPRNPGFQGRQNSFPFKNICSRFPQLKSFSILFKIWLDMHGVFKSTSIMVLKQFPVTSWPAESADQTLSSSQTNWVCLNLAVGCFLIGKLFMHTLLPTLQVQLMLR